MIVLGEPSDPPRVLTFASHRHVIARALRLGNVARARKVLGELIHTLDDPEAVGVLVSVRQRLESGRLDAALELVRDRRPMGAGLIALRLRPESSSDVGDLSRLPSPARAQILALITRDQPAPEPSAARRVLEF